MKNTIKSIIRRFIKPRYHKLDIKLKYKLFGADEASFPLITSELDQDSLIYSFGIGEDISFETEALKEFSCTIHGFDPTPKSIEWLSSQELPENFHVHQIGIGGSDGEVVFYPPENNNYVSYSISPAKNSDTRKAVHSNVMRLGTIIESLGTNLPDVVRMNVEGFEYDAVEEIVKSGLRPKQLIVEFHHGLYNISGDKTISTVRKITDAGYKIFYISDHGRDYGFYHMPE